MPPSKHDVAVELVQWHFQVEPGLVQIFIIGADEKVPYPTLIAELTPEEFDAVKAGQLALPRDWDLAKAQEHGLSTRG
ncbi:MAG: hypothetical protein WCI05_18405 [Myxococcales bacterium]